MISYEANVCCDVAGCQQLIGGMAYESPEKARRSAEEIGRRRGWVINHAATRMVHVCHIHSQDYVHNTNQSEIHQDHSSPRHESSSDSVGRTKP